MGTRVTAPGSIIDASTSPNSSRLNGNRKYANPNATSELEIVIRPADSTAMRIEFPTQASSGSFSQTST